MVAESIAANTNPPGNVPDMTILEYVSSHQKTRFNWVFFYQNCFFFSFPQSFDMVKQKY